MSKQKWTSGLVTAMCASLASGVFAGEPNPSPRRIAPPTRIPDPVVNASVPAGVAVAAADVPRVVRRAVVADAARRFNVAESAVVLARVEQVTWPDGALGCPESGQMYTQALVSGYRVVAKTSAGEMVYHTDARGNARNCAMPPATDPGEGISERLRKGSQPRTTPPATLPAAQPPDR